MCNNILKQNSASPFAITEIQILSDPFMPVSRSKTLEHENRLPQNEITQKLPKSEETKS